MRDYLQKHNVPKTCRTGLKRHLVNCIIQNTLENKQKKSEKLNTHFKDQEKITITLHSQRKELIKIKIEIKIKPGEDQ